MQNTPWLLRMLCCATCSVVIRRNVTPQYAQRSEMCEKCRRDVFRACERYCNPNPNEELKDPMLSFVGVESTKQHMLREESGIIALFARNFERLRDFDGFKKWWMDHTHGTEVGMKDGEGRELPPAFERFIGRVTEAYNMRARGETAKRRQVGRREAQVISEPQASRPADAPAEPVQPEAHTADLEISRKADAPTVDEGLPAMDPADVKKFAEHLAEPKRQKRIPKGLQKELEEPLKAIAALQIRPQDAGRNFVYRVGNGKKLVGVIDPEGKYVPKTLYDEGYPLDPELDHVDVTPGVAAQ